MSRYMWLTLLRSKADAPAAIMEFQARVERETGKKLKVLRTDNGGEFNSVEFVEYCAGEGVQFVIGSCHPNNLGHAAILAWPLMALTASTCYS